MTTQLISKLLRSKEASAAVDVRTWPPVLDTGTPTHRHTHAYARTHSSDVMTPICSSDDLPKKKPPLLHKPSNPDTLAYLDFSVSTTGMLAGVKVKSTRAHTLTLTLSGDISALTQPGRTHIVFVRKLI